MKRLPGRPPLDDKAPSTGLCLKLSEIDYDRANRLAKERRESIQDLLRRGLKRILTDERGGSI
jgi:hypothetical protein